MAAQAVRYMVGQSKTFTHALLAKLFKGQAYLSIMPYDKTNGVTWANLSWQGADELFTIKDSFKISQGSGTSTDIKTDQKKEVIDTIEEPGEWTIEGNVPIVCATILEGFYTKGATVAGASSPILGQKGTAYSAQAFFATPKETYVTMLVENEAENQGVALARVKLSVGISMDDSTNPAYLKISGKILSNTESTAEQGDYAICEKYTAA